MANLKTFDPRRLHLERFEVTVTYHATWTYSGLRGILGERHAHGPIFGAVADAGPGQMNLTPAETEDDDRIMAIAGIRSSGLVAEGKRWAAEAESIARDWLEDVYKVLKPQRSVACKVELTALYPVRDPERISHRLRRRYYIDETLSVFAGEGAFHAAVETLKVDGSLKLSTIFGVIGPPHRSIFFTFPNKARDERWWLGLRLIYVDEQPEGMDALAAVWALLERGQADIQRLRSEFQQVVA